VGLGAYTVGLLFSGIKPGTLKCATKRILAYFPNVCKAWIVIANQVEIAVTECLDGLFFIQVVFNSARLVPRFNARHLE